MWRMRRVFAQEQQTATSEVLLRRFGLAVFRPIATAVSDDFAVRLPRPTSAPPRECRIAVGSEFGEVECRRKAAPVPLYPRRSAGVF
jgi:hypothetical protein